MSEPRKRKAISLETKLNIVRRVEMGETKSHVAQSLGLAQSTLMTILSQSKQIKESAHNSDDVTVTKLTRTRSPIVEQMEKMLKSWIDDRPLHMPVTQTMIQEKALSLFNDLKSKQTGEVAEHFAASRGWVEKFKKRANIHNFKLSLETASVDLGEKEITNNDHKSPQAGQLTADGNSSQDADYHFLMSLLPYLRRVTDDRKLIVRTKLQQILCEEDERCSNCKCLSSDRLASLSAVTTKLRLIENLKVTDPLQLDNETQKQSFQESSKTKVQEENSNTSQIKVTSSNKYIICYDKTPLATASTKEQNKPSSVSQNTNINEESDGSEYEPSVDDNNSLSTEYSEPEDASSAKIKPNNADNEDIIMPIKPCDLEEDDYKTTALSGVATRNCKICPDGLKKRSQLVCHICRRPVCGIHRIEKKIISCCICHKKDKRDKNI